MNAVRALLAALCMFAAGPALAQEDILRTLDERDFPSGATRLALIVWSHSYQRLTPVQNAESDGARIAQEFDRLGFDLVRVIPDAKSAKEILDGVEEVRAFIAASTKPVIVVFFFAGHGFQVEGDNYLVPTLASNDSTAQLVEDSVSLTDIGRRLTPPRQASRLLMLLDACRTIRFLEDGSLKDIAIRDDLDPGFRDGNLLAPALVSMAASPRSAARSVSRFEKKSNSPYTTAVASRLHLQGVSLATLLEDTQKQVWQDTDRAQLPTWFNGSTSSTFFLAPGKTQADNDKRAWQTVLDHPGNLRGCALGYLLTYPTGQFALQAEYLLSHVDQLGDYCSIN